MKILSKLDLFKEAHQVSFLEDAMRQIQSRDFEYLVHLIRSTNNQRHIKSHKFKLPVIYPGLRPKDDHISEFPEQDKDAWTATGIFQFDLDLKDQPAHLIENDRFIEDLKLRLISSQKILYAFVSPTRGLKFGLRTDFVADLNETFTSMEARFAQAYNILHKQFSDHFEIILDEKMKSISQALFLSHDPTCYFNSNSGVVPINEKSRKQTETFVENIEHVKRREAVSYDGSIVAKLLKYIPADLSYDEVQHVNMTVLSCLGEDGITLLSNHWSRNAPSDVTKLKSFLARNPVPYFGGMIALALKHVEPSKKGDLELLLKQANDLKWQKPSQSRTEFDDLLSADAGQSALRQAVSEFFDNQASMYVIGSGGLGKTEAVLQAIGQLDADQKVLYLVPTYKLADELLERLRGLHGDRITVAVPQGKTKVCQNAEIRSFYDDQRMAIPSYECMYNCPLKDSCSYILERRHDVQLRIMTHEEYLNEPSMWSYGFTTKPDEAKSLKDPIEGYMPRNSWSGWRPNYIIVDEDWIKLDRKTVNASSHWHSIYPIINSVKSGEALEKAIAGHSEDIFDDQIELFSLQQRKIPFTNRDDYLNQIREHQQNLIGSDVIETLASVMMGDDSQLPRLAVNTDTLEISLNRIKMPAARYKHVPTLYLDATANERVVRTLLPDVDVRRILVRKSPDVVTKMFSNINYSRSKFTDDDDLENAVRQIKPYINEPAKTALVTYKTIQGNITFHEKLADQLGVPKDAIGYFGNLRGLNALAGAEQLIIVGRQWLPSTDYENLCRAIFCEIPATDTVMVPQPINMTDVENQAVKSTRFQDTHMQAVHDHFGLSETIQAFVRGRPIYGSPKEIIFFGFNSLGDAIEIDEVIFDYHHLGIEPYLDELKSRGHIKLGQTELAKFGTTKYAFENHLDDIRDFLTSNGAEIVEITIKGSDRKTRKPVPYAVFDHAKLEEHLKSKRHKIVTWDSKSGPQQLDFAAFNAEAANTAAMPY